MDVYIIDVVENLSSWVKKLKLLIGFTINTPKINYLDKEDTVTEAEAVEVTVASTLLLAVTPVDLKGPGAPV